MHLALAVAHDDAEIVTADGVGRAITGHSAFV
jgi:hypothetical protein